VRALSRILLAFALTFVGGTGFLSLAAPEAASCCDEVCPCPPPPPTPTSHRLPATATAPVAVSASAPAVARKTEPRTDSPAFAAFAAGPQAPVGTLPPFAEGRGRDPDLGRHLAKLSRHRI
jgi:hypothetical protein